jgi:hypothetical protein
MNQRKPGKLKYVMTIPSVDLLNYVAINDLILLGSGDKRYQDLKEQNPVLKQYLDSFKTPFGRKVNPSIIVRDESLPKVDASHLCAFRNAIAIAGVIGSRICSCIHNQTTGFYCTDLFDFYPVSVSSDETDLVAKTPFELSAWCNVNNFAGQTTPAVVYPENIQPAFDEKLMLALLDVVEKKPLTRDEQSFKTRVIRSMEITYYAMRNPFVTLGERSDFGVQMSLWVSAFEILANPHIENVRFSDVSAMIKAVAWRDKKLRVKQFAAVGAQQGRKTTFPVQIYGRLYQTRNAYMHGNALHKGEYEFHKRKRWGNLFFQAPALYRCVLMHALNSKGFGELLAHSQEHDLYERVLLSKNDK